MFFFLFPTGEKAGKGKKTGCNCGSQPEQKLQHPRGGNDDPSCIALHATIARGPPSNVGGGPDAGRGGAG